MQELTHSVKIENFATKNNTTREYTSQCYKMLKLHFDDVNTRANWFGANLTNLCQLNMLNYMSAVANLRMQKQIAKNYLNLRGICTRWRRKHISSVRCPHLLIHESAKRKIQFDTTAVNLRGRL